MMLLKDASISDCIRHILSLVGENPTRDGLKETPIRVERMYLEKFAAHKEDAGKILKTFEDSCSEMVVLRDIDVHSFCEHHLMPFYGRAHVAYIPDGKVVGISKLARLVDLLSSKLQIQERLTEEITGALDKYLKPRGSACVIEARHMCMMARGVCKQNAVMTTSSLTGVFRDDTNKARDEFLSLVHHSR